jgi:hypothetical protein
MSGRYDWTINQGETSELTVTITDSGGSAVNYAQNSTFKMQARDKFGGTVALELTTNGAVGSGSHFEHGLSSGASNTFKVIIPATLSTAITAPAKYVYDIENTSGTTVKRVIEGSLIVTPEVTL